MIICCRRREKRNVGSCSIRCEYGWEGEGSGDEIGMGGVFIIISRSTALSPSLQDHETPDLQLLLAMTDLLASCSEGENPMSESVCQTVYSVEELLRILNEPKLPPEHKRPFARFLVWVYMNTQKDKIQSGISKLANSK